MLRQRERSAKGAPLFFVQKRANLLHLFLWTVPLRKEGITIGMRLKETHAAFPKRFLNSTCSSVLLDRFSRLFCARSPCKKACKEGLDQRRFTTSPSG